MAPMPLPFSDSDVDAAFPAKQIQHPELGRGSFKVAYVDSSEEITVLKILTDALDPDQDGTSVDDSALDDRFVREIRAMQLTDSPHLGKILVAPRAVSIAGVRYAWYEEPYYGGGTLTDRLARGAMPADDAALLTVALLEAVRELWKHKLVHRDIKPGNIVFDGNAPVLIDPGIALHVGLDDLTDSSGSSPKTPAFSAPEQHEVRRYAEIDFRTDHFLVGIVAYMAFSGRHPIWEPGMDPRTFIVKLLTFDRVDVSSLPCSPEMQRVIGRLLAPKPHRRYRTVDEPLRELGVA